MAAYVLTPSGKPVRTASSDAPIFGVVYNLTAPAIGNVDVKTTYTFTVGCCGRSRMPAVHGRERRAVRTNLYRRRGKRGDGVVLSSHAANRARQLDLKRSVGLTGGNDGARSWWRTVKVAAGVSNYAPCRNPRHRPVR